MSMVTRLAHMADRIWHLVGTVSYTQSAIISNLKLASQMDLKFVDCGMRSADCGCAPSQSAIRIPHSAISLSVLQTQSSICFAQIRKPRV
jgi:hypothetical protein